MSFSDLDSFEQKLQKYNNEYICEDCIKDNDLENIANCEDDKQKCRYCGQTKKKTAELSAVFRNLKEEIDSKYPSAEETIPIEKGKYMYEPKTIDDIIGNFCAIDNDQLYKDIVDDVFVDEAYDYYSRDDLELDFYSQEWFLFRQNILYEKRYTFPLLQQEMSFLKLLNEFINSNNMFKTIPANSDLYRIRIGKYDNVLDLCPPPREKTPDNRMNPKGIPMFYCSEKEETALKEINVSKIQEIITVAKFNNLKPLYILDFSNITTKVNNVQADFLFSFINDISRPLLSDDINKLSYIPTQIITEYFRYF